MNAERDVPLYLHMTTVEGAPGAQGWLPFTDGAQLRRHLRRLRSVPGVEWTFRITRTDRSDA